MLEMSRQFQRTIENFACGNCGNSVIGDGYTNHCPSCLYSKHVDVNPGDRAAECGGLMKPVGIEQKKGDYVIVHECVDCGHMRKNKRGDTDDFNKIIEISSAGLGSDKQVPQTSSGKKREPL